MTQPATASLPTDAAILQEIADEAAAAFNCGERRIRLFTERYPGLTMDDAYRVTALAHRMRVAQGYKPLGRKIGFTNRRMWTEYGVRAPNWGYVYDRTVRELSDPSASFPRAPAGSKPEIRNDVQNSILDSGSGDLRRPEMAEEAIATLSLAPYSAPKIEPEIMFGLARTPLPGMNDAALLSCIEWVALGYEIVQSIYPDWIFTAVDTTIANALHGALLIGPRHAIGTHADEWLRTLSSFDIELSCNGRLMDTGQARNVLEGPLSTIRYVMDLFDRDEDNPPLIAGEIISTGTLTRALPVKKGETWTAVLKDIAIESATLRFC